MFQLSARWRSRHFFAVMSIIIGTGISAILLLALMIETLGRYFQATYNTCRSISVRLRQYPNDRSIAFAVRIDQLSLADKRLGLEANAEASHSRLQRNIPRRFLYWSYFRVTPTFNPGSRWPFACPCHRNVVDVCLSVCLFGWENFM